MEDITWRDEYVASPQEREAATEAAIAGRRRCRELANELHAVLPIELRNMIYTYIVGPSAQLEYAFDSHGIIQIGFFDSGQSEELDGLSMFGESGQIQPRSWAMDPAYFGSDVAKELAEAYYALNRFAVTSEEFLGPFLTADPLGLGIKPYKHIRCLDLALDFEDLYHVDFASMASHLEALQLIPSRQRKMDIYINLTTSFQLCVEHSRNTRLRWYTTEAERIMLNILELLRWPVYELLHKGHAVQIFHENLDMGDRTSSEVGERELTRYRFTDSTIRHKTDFFYMTEEEWLEEKGGNTVADPASHYVLPLSRTGNDESNVDETEEDQSLQERVRKALKRRWDKDGALKGFRYAYENQA